VVELSSSYDWPSAYMTNIAKAKARESSTQRCEPLHLAWSQIPKNIKHKAKNKNYNDKPEDAHQHQVAYWPIEDVL
jgi:hypothetical protein